MIKAVCLFSGGLDSIVASKLIQSQGIDVRLVNFTTPFFLPKKAKDMARQLGMKLKVVDVTKDYLKILRNPKHGYGSDLNPCIDCKIMMIKKAKEYARSIGAKFVFTGEVLGERPMSQNKNALEMIEKDAGMKGKLLRPLSAKLLPATEAEKWVDKSKLLDIQGRSRERQFGLARKFKVNYPTPSGGCLLTNKEYAIKAKDMLENNKKISSDDIRMLKIGRHFRFGKNKMIVGRDRFDNKELLGIKSKGDYAFEVSGVPSPVTILQGPKTKKAIDAAAKLTAFYSDAKEDQVKVRYGKKFSKTTSVRKMEKEEVESLRIISFS
ncbi:MAG: tRNA 4-thiouridine(8) synthase ThiI [Candidatus Aenigmatarchaeota archaeon]